MDTTTTTLIVGLSTVLASGVMSSVVTYRLNRNKDQTEFLREKAERLYLAADEFGTHFVGQMLTYFPLLKGDIDYNQMLEMQIERGAEEKKHGGAQTMTMLAEIYFPTVRTALDAVWSERDAFNKLTQEVKATWMAYGTFRHSDMLKRFQAASLALNGSFEAPKKEIVAAARVHAGVKHL